MSKDPAMLWYWNDWHSSTVLLSRFLKGCYMDIMHAQFNNGRLSLEEIKTCLGSDFGTSWPTLQKKFKQDQNGLFFNERLEQEKEKRKAFSESRRSNVSKRHSKSTYVDTSVEHMKPHMENVNENRNEDSFKRIRSSDFSTMPIPSEVTGLPEIKVGAVIELMKITRQTDVTPEQVNGMFNVFKIQNLTGKKYYPDPEAVYSHFINWIRTKNFDNAAKPSSAKQRANNSAERLANKIKDQLNVLTPRGTGDH